MASATPGPSRAPAERRNRTASSSAEASGSELALDGEALCSVEAPAASDSFAARICGDPPGIAQTSHRPRRPLGIFFNLYIPLLCLCHGSGTECYWFQHFTMLLVQNSSQIIGAWIRRDDCGQRSVIVLQGGCLTQEGFAAIEGLFLMWVPPPRCVSLE